MDKLNLSSFVWSATEQRSDRVLLLFCWVITKLIHKSITDTSRPISIVSTISIVTATLIIISIV